MHPRIHTTAFAAALAMLLLTPTVQAHDPLPEPIVIRHDVDDARYVELMRQAEEQIARGPTGLPADVVLTREQRILLPEEGALTAFQKVIALDKAQDLLARDVAVIDFRNPQRPVLRRGTSGIEGLFETDLILDEGE